MGVSVGELEAALRADLERWGATVADSALAAAALDTARRLDTPGVSPSAASLLHGQLRQYLADLRDLAPPKEDDDEVADLQAEYQGLRAVQ